MGDAVHDRPAGQPAAHVEAPSAVPIPPRFWWLKRLSAAGVLWLLLLVAVRWWWGWEAERRLRAQIAEYRAAGQPVLFEDFPSSSVPDEDNAAQYLTQAAATISSRPDAFRDLHESIGDPAQRRARLSEVRQVVEQNAEALRLVRVARDKTAADWKCPLRSPLFAAKLPNLSPQRNLSRLVCIAALHEHERGNDDGAIEHVFDALALGRHSESIAPVLIVHLVRIAQDELALRAVEDLAYELCVASTQRHDAQGEFAPASPDRLHELIRTLLDEADLRDHGRLCMYGERTMELDSVLWTVGARLRLGPSVPFTLAAGWSPTFPPPFAALFGPSFYLDALRMMRHATCAAEAYAARDYPAALALMPRDTTPTYAPQFFARLLSQILLPTFDRALTLEFRAQARRRLAAVALAMRMYEVDHARLPAALAELVPDYLPAVPEDPFDAQHAPLRFRAEAPGPLVYSVGNNGADDGGSFAVKTDGAVDMDALDIPFFFTAEHPRARPTTRPTSGPFRPPWSPPPSAEALPEHEKPEHAERKERQQQH